jgi:hypothetical protein
LLLLLPLADIICCDLWLIRKVRSCILNTEEMFCFLRIM